MTDSKKAPLGRLLTLLDGSAFGFTLRVVAKATLFRFRSTRTCCRFEPYTKNTVYLY